MRTVFVYDYASPYSYLANVGLLRLAEAGGRSIDLLPVPVLELQKRVGNVPTSITRAAKRAYVERDLRRWAQRYAVPFTWPPTFRQTDFAALLRGAVVAQQVGYLTDYNEAVFNALWSTSADLTSVEAVQATLDGSQIAVKVPGPGDAAANALLETNLAAAINAGAFGTPTIIVGDELFFGNDRLDFAAHAMGIDTHHLGWKGGEVS